MKRVLLLACLFASPAAALAQMPGIDNRVGSAIDPGFRDCRTWCQVRIEGAEARPSPEMGAPGRMRPELWLAVRVRNDGPVAVKLEADDVVFYATDTDLPQMGDVAISDGPWSQPSVSNSRHFPLLEAGQSVLVYHRFWRLPDNVRTFHLKADNQFALSARAWAAGPLSAEFRELERNLFLAGNLSYIPANAPAPTWADDFVGDWDLNGQRVVVTRDGNKIVVRTLHAHGAHQNQWEFGATTNPARLMTPDIGASRESISNDPRGYLQLWWDKQTLQMVSSSSLSTYNWTARRAAAAEGEAEQSPSPAPSPTTPPAPSPGSPATPPGSPGFKAVGPFDVRFGDLERPRGSNVVRAVITIRNTSEQVQHLASGTFRAILTDADGAGQERNQIWRGSGEPAQLFNGTPAILPGGELTVRFTFNPDIRELDKLVLMRGQEQVEFDLTGE